MIMITCLAGSRTNRLYIDDCRNVCVQNIWKQHVLRS